MITVGRHDEALLLAEASLKVRVDSKQKDQDYQYRQQMQSVVLAIALSTRQFDRAYPILKGKESVFGELTSFGESSIFGELPNISQTNIGKFISRMDSTRLQVRECIGSSVEFVQYDNE